MELPDPILPAALSQWQPSITLYALHLLFGVHLGPAHLVLEHQQALLLPYWMSETTWHGRRQDFKSQAALASLAFHVSALTSHSQYQTDLMTYLHKVCIPTCLHESLKLAFRARLWALQLCWHHLC